MLCDFIRVVWWSCHCLEQSGTNRLHRMPCAVCVGHVVWLLQCVYGLFCFQSSRTKYAWKGMSADPLWTYEMFVQYLARIIFFLSLSVCLSACLPACLPGCLSVCLPLLILNFKCFCVHFHVQASSSIRTCMVCKCISVYHTFCNNTSTVLSNVPYLKRVGLF